MVFRTTRTSETVRIGKRLGHLLEPGDVVALVGELGTGKTQFIKGLAQGLGIGRGASVSSPSFTLIHEYPGKVPFYHIDLFRLNSEKEAEGLGLEDYFAQQGVTAIEWADKICSFLPETFLVVKIYHTGKSSRSIELIPKGKRYEELVKKMGNSEFVSQFRRADKWKRRLNP